MSDINALLSSRSNEWYTPSIYVEAAREVMGGIDLDPASCELANRTVQATRYYTKEQNGLAQPLYGRIWCNLPYGTSEKGKSNQGIWIKRLVEEYERGTIEQAVILSNAATDTRWFHRLFVYPVCLTKGRINFYTATHKTDTAFSKPEKGQSTHGSAFTYLGPNTARFVEVFSQFGTIVQRIAGPPARPVTLPLWEEVAS
jgi:hypothetical protein